MNLERTCPDGPAKPMLLDALGEGDMDEENVAMRGDSSTSSNLTQQQQQRQHRSG